jgi:hypothetical protein
MAIQRYVQILVAPVLVFTVPLGMAIRLAFDLALHKDMTAYIAKGTLSEAEANLRRTVFWGAYLVDQ